MDIFCTLCLSGSLEQIKQKLKEGPQDLDRALVLTYLSLSLRNNARNTYHSMKIVHFLLKKGADPNKVMYNIGRYGNINHIKYLIKTYKITNFNSGLEGAVTHGHVAAAELFIKYGATNLYHALYLAAAGLHGENLDIMKLLIKSGATNINEAFRAACKYANMRTVNFLIKNGPVDYNEGLLEACTFNNESEGIYHSPSKIRMIRFLIHRGADNYDEAFYEACEGQNVEFIRHVFEVLPSINIDNVLMIGSVRERYRIVAMIVDLFGSPEEDMEFGYEECECENCNKNIIKPYEPTAEQKIKEEKIVAMAEKLDKDNNAVPDRFKCPISLDIMSDPVLISSGRIYNKKHIELWIKNNNTDPLTKERVLSILYPVHTLKQEIFEWLEQIEHQVVQKDT